jgi:dynein cytoplasmic 1 intermediate chain
LVLGDRAQQAVSVGSTPNTPTRPEPKSLVRIGDHMAPVQSVHSHPWALNPTEHNIHTQSDFGRLLVSASSDWTCAVYEQDGSYASDPLFRLDHSSAVYDARWSPTHPSLLTSVDEAGSLNLWNLAQDTDSPVASLRVGSDSPEKGDLGDLGKSSGHALARARWSHDGKLVAVGDSVGRVHTVHVNHSYAPGHGPAEEIHMFDDTVRTISGL